MTPPRQAAATRLQRLERRLLDRRAEAQLRSMDSEHSDGRHPALASRLAILLLCAPVHAVSAGAAVGGLWLLVAGANWPQRVLGALLLLTAYATRPGLHAMPDHEARLDPRSCPTLFGLVDDIAAALAAPAPDEILVRERFGASAARVGFRRLRVLTIGASGWVGASPGMRVSLIAHELGHFAHGDLAHLWWVSGAQRTLASWNDIAGGHARNHYEGRAKVVQRYAMAPLRGLISGYLAVIRWAEAPSSQRQEYLADLDSATAAGTRPAVEMLDLLLRRDAVEMAITRAAVHPRRPDIWDTVRAEVADHDPTTAVRRRESAARERSRIDDSHPATPLRIRLLEARPPLEPRVVVAPEVALAIDDELRAPLAAAAQAAGERIRYQR